MLGLSQLNLQGIFPQWQGDTWLSTTTKGLKLKVKVKEQVNGRMRRQRKYKKIYHIHHDVNTIDGIFIVKVMRDCIGIKEENEEIDNIRKTKLIIDNGCQ